MPDIIPVTFLSRLLPQHKPLTTPLSSGPERYGGSLWAHRFLCLPRQRWLLLSTARDGTTGRAVRSRVNSQLYWSPFPELPDPALPSLTRHTPCQCTSFADYLPLLGHSKLESLGVTCSFPSPIGFKQSAKQQKWCCNTAALGFCTEKKTEKTMQ